MKAIIFPGNHTLGFFIGQWLEACPGSGSKNNGFHVSLVFGAVRLPAQGMSAK